MQQKFYRKHALQVLNLFVHRRFACNEQIAVLFSVIYLAKQFAVAPAVKAKAATARLGLLQIWARRESSLAVHQSTTPRDTLRRLRAYFACHL